MFFDLRNTLVLTLYNTVLNAGVNPPRSVGYATMTRSTVQTNYFANRAMLDRFYPLINAAHGRIDMYMGSIF